MNKKILMIMTMVASAGAFAQVRGPLGSLPQRNAPAAAPAAAASESKEAPALNWDQAPVDIVLQAYGDQLNKTILKDPGVPNATISLKSKEGQTLTQDEYLEAIEVVLEMNGVHVEPYGEKFIRAIPRAKVRKDGVPLYMGIAEVPDDYKDGRVISVRIQLKNIGTEEAQKALEGFKSDSGLLQIFERTNSILITDTWQNIQRMNQIVESIDTSTPVQEQVFVYQVKNASASDIKTALEQIVQESQKQLEKDKGANSNVAQPNLRPAGSPLLGGNRLLNRNQPQQPQPVNNESLVMSISDADRGMIRGKVLIIADERSNKLVIITAKTNYDFFEKVIKELDVETTPDTVVKVYRLKYADSEDVSDMINDLIGNSAKSSNSSRGNQNANARNGQNSNVTRSGSNRNTAQNKGANQRSGDAKAGELTKDNTTVLSDKRINGLVVMTEKELVPTIESIIESMDVKLSQVLIETVIIEVTLGDDLKTGVDWVRNGRHFGVRTQATDSYGRKLFWEMDDESGKMVQTATPDDPESAIAVMVEGMVKGDLWNGDSRYASVLGGGALDTVTGGGIAADIVTGVASNLFGGALNYIFKSDALNLSAVIQATKSDNRAKYIASPVVMTVDNKEATIDATASKQFLTGWQAVSSSYAGSGMPSPNYTAKDIGIKVKVTPKINPNGTVMLNVEEEYNQVNETQMMKTPQGNTYVNTEIDVPSTRKMTSDVLLENMQTVIFGGLMESHKVERESGIPILKDIPWIGKWLFGHVEHSESRTELLVFMTPYVLNDGEAAQAEAIRRKKTLPDANAWDDNGWSASPLADPVSKKEQLRRLKDEWKKQDEERKARIAIEQEKVKRVQRLREMDEEERNLWLEMHKEELEDERLEELEEKMEDPKSQEELKKLAAEVRERSLREAAEAQKNAEDDQKRKSSEDEAVEKAVRGEKPAEPGPAPESVGLLDVLAAEGEKTE